VHKFLENPIFGKSLTSQITTVVLKGSKATLDRNVFTVLKPTQVG